MEDVFNFYKNIPKTSEQETVNYFVESLDSLLIDGNFHAVAYILDLFNPPEHPISVAVAVVTSGRFVKDGGKDSHYESFYNLVNRCYDYYKSNLEEKKLERLFGRYKQ